MRFLHLAAGIFRPSAQASSFVVDPSFSVCEVEGCEIAGWSEFSAMTL